MSIVNNAVSFEDLESGLMAKISDLKIGNNLRGGWGVDTVHEISEFSEELHKMLQEVENHKAALQLAKCQINEVKQLFSFIDVLSARLSYMKINLPSHVPALLSSDPIATHLAKTIEQHQGVKSKTKPAGENVEKIHKPIPTLQYITLTEYETVPKYTRGRISYDKVNSVVDELNNAVSAKYTLIRKQRSKLTPLEMSKVSNYKQQVNQECKGLYFVVDDDLKSFSNLKLDTSTRNVLTILRTLKRLKEVRGPGNLLRYCVQIKRN